MKKILYLCFFCVFILVFTFVFLLFVPSSYAYNIPSFYNICTNLKSVESEEIWYRFSSGYNSNLQCYMLNVDLNLSGVCVLNEIRSCILKNAYCVNTFYGIPCSQSECLPGYERFEQNGQCACRAWVGTTFYCVNKPYFGWDQCNDGVCPVGEAPYVNGDSCTCNPLNFDCSQIYCSAGTVCNPANGACENIICEAHKCRKLLLNGSGCYNLADSYYDESENKCTTQGPVIEGYKSGLHFNSKSGVEHRNRFFGRGGYEKRQAD